MCTTCELNNDSTCKFDGVDNAAGVDAVGVGVVLGTHAVGSGMGVAETRPCVRVCVCVWFDPSCTFTF